jgi:hypothetical protein
LAKAVPDECWNGCGMPYIPASNGMCPADTLPKRNQAYAWGLAQWGKDVWIGTVANVAGIAAGAAAAGSSTLPPGSGGTTGDCQYIGSLDNPINVSEGSLSQYPGVPEVLRPFLGDWRPPQVWLYDSNKKVQTDMTPADSRIDTTLGLRAAGVADDVVIFAGPRRTQIGVNLFAFDAKTKTYLGSTTLWQYSSIRKFVVAGGKLYTGVQTPDGRGQVLRWTGNKQQPFRFQVVGSLDNDAANLAEHEGRLYVATWRPDSSLSGVAGISFGERPQAGIWMSPPIPEGGLRTIDAFRWTKVWEISDYEPDEVVALGQGGVGDLASFGGYLYWGHMARPWGAYAEFVKVYGEPTNPDEVLLNVHRAIPIFRGRNFHKTPEIELLYGEERLPKYNGATWSLVNNNLGGAAPLFGPAGFGVPTNAYTWTMAVFRSKLYVGTLDTAGILGNSPDLTPGADLWVFADKNSAATPVTLDGFGHPQTVYGVRTMVPSANTLFVGTAGAANLSPDGGWKLIGITP